MIDFQALAESVRVIAKEEILPRYRVVGSNEKSDGSLVTEADLAVNDRLMAHLKAIDPDTAVLSEEMDAEQQDQVLAAAPRFWCIDPLDGTSNFVAGVPLFATALALIEEGEVRSGVIYDPIRDELFTAQKGQGAQLNGAVLKASTTCPGLDQSVALVDFKRLPLPVSQSMLEDFPFRSQRNLGSSVLEWAWMSCGRGQIYLHGGMKFWDMAAGSLLLDEAGGYSSDASGAAVYKQRVNDIDVVASPEKQLFEQWLDYVKAVWVPT